MKSISGRRIFWMGCGTSSVHSEICTRTDALDMGLWSKIPPSSLLMPLDTHTFHVARKLGLLKRKSYDIKAVLELTGLFRKWDPNDPVKYDFALYRIGQEKLSLIRSD